MLPLIIGILVTANSTTATSEIAASEQCRGPTFGDRHLNMMAAIVGKR